ncbi:unnamed protein product [marine sediment metagenome]|uniref:Uncharacterized protein n=1 Tax=marine sediment metagenome TaxID=412755 RepID=X1AG69_9ZZZZ
MKTKAPGLIITLVNGSKLWINKEIDLTQEIITLDIEDVTELVFKKQGDQIGCLAIAGTKLAGKILEMQLFKHSILFIERVDMDSFIYQAVLKERTGLILQQGHIS